jgi:hypothetical protein
MLNPLFVEALMGWPWRWSTASIVSDCSGMESFPTKPPQLSCCSPDDSLEVA